MEVPLLQCFPFVAVEPDAFASMTVIDRKAQAAADEILNHPKTALRTIERQARLGERQGFMLNDSFRQIRFMILDPFPIFGAGDPVAAATGTLPGRKTYFKLIRR